VEGDTTDVEDCDREVGDRVVARHQVRRRVRPDGRILKVLELLVTAAKYLFQNGLNPK